MPRFTLDHTPLLDPPAMCWPRWTQRGSGLRTVAGELELHFEVDAFTRRVSGSLRAPGGDALERLSATEALLLACGDAALVLDAHALAA